MLSKLKSLLSRLVGPGESTGGESAGPEEPAGEPVAYKDYRIRPAPYRAGAQYQTAGIVEKDFPDGMKAHRFVRAETHASKDDAIAFSIAKAKQIVDERGDRMFEAG